MGLEGVASAVDSGEWVKRILDEPMMNVSVSSILLASIN